MKVQGLGVLGFGVLLRTIFSCYFPGVAKHKLLLGSTVSVMLLLLLTFFATFYFGLRVNSTSSMQEGFYKIDTTGMVKKGESVTLCLPKKIAEWGFSRKYLGRGSCSTGYTPLLKEVIAVPGDRVSITGAAIIVNGKRYSAPQQLLDDRGRSLPVVSFNKQRIEGYVVYGKHNIADSWDSRYYGVLPASSVRAVVHHLSF